MLLLLVSGRGEDISSMMQQIAVGSIKGLERRLDWHETHEASPSFTIFTEDRLSHALFIASRGSWEFRRNFSVSYTFGSQSCTKVYLLRLIRVKISEQGN